MSRKLFQLAGALLLFILSQPASSQISKADSLSALIKTDKDDTNKVNHLRELGWEFMFQNTDTAIILCKKALELATTILTSPAQKNPSINRSTQRALAKIYGNLGAYDFLKSEYKTSLEYYFKAIDISESLGEKNIAASTYNNVGIVFRNQGDHTLALEYYFKALKLNVELGNKVKIAQNLNNLGLVYYDQQDHKKALEYFDQAMRLNQNLGNQAVVATNLNNIGNVYFAKKDYPKALEYYFKSLKLNDTLGIAIESAGNLGNIGAAYHKNNDLPMALEYYQKALKLNQEIENTYSIAFNLGNIGQIYSEEKNYKEAEEYLMQALAIAKEIGSLEAIKENNEALSKLYSETNRFELAFKHYQDFTAAKDSLFNDEKSKDIGRLEMRHEIEKVERERKLAEEEKIRTATKARKRKNELQYSGMFVGLLGIGLVVLMIGFVKVSPPVARSVTFFAFLLLFEFILLLIDPYVEKYSGGEPLYKLFINALLAACIFPLNAIMESGLKRRLMKKEQSAK